MSIQYRKPQIARVWKGNIEGLSNPLPKGFIASLLRQWGLLNIETKTVAKFDKSKA